MSVTERLSGQMPSSKELPLKAGRFLFLSLSILFVLAFSGKGISWGEGDCTD
jgi:hypothetical protein